MPFAQSRGCLLCHDCGEASNHLKESQQFLACLERCCRVTIDGRGCLEFVIVCCLCAAPAGANAADAAGEQRTAAELYGRLQPGLPNSHSGCCRPPAHEAVAPVTALTCPCLLHCLTRCSLIAADFDNALLQPEAVPTCETNCTLGVEDKPLGAPENADVSRVD